MLGVVGILIKRGDMSKLETTWWFSLPVSLAGMLLALFITSQAGFPGPADFSGAQWILYLVLAFGLQRCFSFLGWLLVLMVLPSTAAPERTRVDRSWPQS